MEETMKIRRPLALSFYLLLGNISLFAQAPGAIDTTIHRNDAGKRIYTTQRLQSPPPQIDGRLDDLCWQNEGVWSGSYTQQIPTEGAEPTAPTALKIFYDDRNIYVAIRAFDDPKLIDRNRGRRDDMMGDIVGVCFDSYFDHRTGFEFDLTAAGGKIDLILTNGSWEGGVDASWDAVWEGKTAEEENAWTAEFRIPLNQIRYADQKEQVWGLHAWRWINRNMEEDQWALIPRDSPSRMSDIGELHGIRNLPKNRRIELLPYARAQNHRFAKEAGNPFSTGSKSDYTAGLDGKIGISSDFTMDFTLNPDFGQVEADPSVLNLTVFETFYEEKRPFFLEGKNIFDFEVQDNLLFYSRRIGHQPSYQPELPNGQYADLPQNTAILGAAKISGKSKNGLSFGILESVTHREQAEIADGSERYQQTVEPLSNFFVSRVQKEYNGSNTVIGGILTTTHRRIEDEHLNFLNRSAYTGGLDLRHHWLDKTYYLDAKAVFSTVEGHEKAIQMLQTASTRYFQRPDADYVDVDSSRTSLAGHGVFLEVGKGGNGNWRWEAGANWRTPGLELNDLGFMQDADNIAVHGDIGYVQNRPQGIFRSYAVETGYDKNWNFGREALNTNMGLDFEGELANKWRVFTNIVRENDHLDTRLLRGGPAVRVQGWWHNMASISTDGSKRFSVGVSTHAHIHDDRVSKTLNFGPFANWKATNVVRLVTNVSLSRNTDALQYISTLPSAAGDTYILGELARKTIGMTLRLDVSLTPELTIQYYANPYISVGNYSNIKKVTQPRADGYEALYHVFDDGEIRYQAQDNQYVIAENGQSEYTLDNPDFNFREFRSNLVARWEFRPGSTLFLVWTHGRSLYENILSPTLNDGMNTLFNAAPENVYLIKFNYWFSI